MGGHPGNDILTLHDGYRQHHRPKYERGISFVCVTSIGGMAALDGEQ
jgi:hypothetical protein